MHLRILLPVILCLTLLGTAHGRSNELGVGDSAPGLDIERWISGDEVTIEADKTYLVFFFDPDDNKSAQYVLDLDEVHKRLGYKGLVILGITTKEDLGFLKRRVYQGYNKDFGYSIAVDRRESTKRAWMDAAGKNRMPVVFLVDKKGKIQYIGSIEGEDFSTILMLVMDGRYSARLFREAEPILRAAENARKLRNWRLCNQHLDKVIEMDTHVFAFTCLTKFKIRLEDMNEKEAAYEYARELLTKYANDPTFLAAMAEMIATDPEIKDENRDLEIAMAAAELAAAGYDENEPERYALPAMVHYHAGRLREAVNLQKDAWMKAIPQVKESYRRVLRGYQEALQREQIKTGSDG